MKKNILLISISRSWLLSLRQLASYALHDSEIKDKVKFTLLERQLENLEERTLIKSILKIIKEENVSVVCFSAYIWNRKLLERIAKEIKKFNSEIINVWGGPEFIIDLPDKDLSIYDAIHFEPDGEESFLSFIKNYLNGDFKQSLGFAYYDPKEKTFVKNKFNKKEINVDWLYKSYIFFPLDFYNYNPTLKGEINYELMRGCSNSCYYCTWYLHKKFIKDQEQSANELNYIIDNVPEKYKKVINICFIDSISDTKKHVDTVKLINKTYEGSIDLLLSDSPDLGIFDLTKEYKLKVDIAINSRNEESLKYVNRKAYNTDKIFKLIDKLSNLPISAGNIHLMLGLPKSNYEENIKELDFFQNNFGWKMFCSLLCILPGTVLKKKVDMDKGYLYSEEPPYNIISTPDFSKEEIIKLKKIIENHYHYSCAIYKNSKCFKDFIEYNKRNRYNFSFEIEDMTSLLFNYSLDKDNASKR